MTHFFIIPMGNIWKQVLTEPMQKQKACATFCSDQKQLGSYVLDRMWCSLYSLFNSYLLFEYIIVECRTFQNNHISKTVFSTVKMLK